MCEQQSSIQQHMQTLFDADELIAFKPNAYTLKWEATPREQYFVLNPLKERAGGALLNNVSTFRNVLVEFDTKTLSQQEKYIERELEMPFTTKVWSGSKSFHYVISLATPVPSLDDYRRLVDCIYGVVRFMDRAVRNANRLSRLGGATREDNGERQTLVEIRSRVTSEELKWWLFNKWGHLTEKALMPKIIRDVVETRDSKNPTHATLRLIEEGVMQRSAKSRHQALLFAALNLKECGWTEERVQQVLEETADRIGVSERGDVDGIIRWTFRAD